MCLETKSWMVHTNDSCKGIIYCDAVWLYNSSAQEASIWTKLFPPWYSGHGQSVFLSTLLSSMAYMKTHMNSALVNFQEKYFLCQWIFVSVLSENEKMHAFNFSLVPWGVASQVALVVRNLPASAGDIRNASSIPGLGRSSGGGVAAHSSVLAWRIP